jgi:predicted peroxiredoxin
VSNSGLIGKLLIHVTRGPEDPSRAALAFLVGKAAIAEGHEVMYFLAADAVGLLRQAVLDSLVGLGTGSLRESYDALVAGGARFYVSGLSSKARGFDPGDVAEAAMPDRLVQLAFEADRVLSY